MAVQIFGAEKREEIVAKFSKDIVKEIRKSIPAKNPKDIQTAQDIQETYVSESDLNLPTPSSDPALFSIIRQGKSTNALSKLNDKKLSIDKHTGTAMGEIGGVMLTIPDYLKKRTLKTSTNMLLDMLVILCGESGFKSTTVLLSLDEYMKRRKLSDRKESRKRMVEDLDTLLKASISWEEKRKGGAVLCGGVNIVDSWEWLNKNHTVVSFVFGQRFFDTLRGYPIMMYPNDLFGIDLNKNPNSWYIGRKIAEHKWMNAGKKNEDVISVQTLLNASLLPSFNEVTENHGKHYAQLIREPFERDMDALPFLKWEYCEANGFPVSQEDIESKDPRLFFGWNVKIIWENYPDQTQRIENKKKAIEKAKKKRERKEKAAKKQE